MIDLHSAAVAPLAAETTLLELKVASVVEVADGVKQFELLPCGGTLPRVEAGAHIDVLTGNGIFRAYSLVNLGEDHRYVIAVRFVPGSSGGSQYMYDFVDAGEILTVRLAANGFPLHDGPGPALLVAGGIGITPILCLGRALSARGADFELHYCGRDLLRMAYQADIRREFGERAHVYESEAGHRMHLPHVFRSRPPGTHLYVCGPRSMIDEARNLAADWPVDNVHYEIFVNSSATKSRIAPPATAFQIKLARSRRVLDVSSTETILDVLLRNGISVPHACTSGLCGTCAVPLLAGEADHRDTVLTGQERKNRIQTCCSRAPDGECLVLDR